MVKKYSFLTELTLWMLLTGLTECAYDAADGFDGVIVLYRFIIFNTSRPLASLAWLALAA